jgi:hypothetical protein
VLCGQLELAKLVKEPDAANDSQHVSSGSGNNNKDDKATSAAHDFPRSDLMLYLCKQSELKNVSAEIDRLSNQIKSQLLDETWKVSLLNSLFSLFIEWEPF